MDARIARSHQLHSRGLSVSIVTAAAEYGGFDSTRSISVDVTTAYTIQVPVSQWRLRPIRARSRATRCRTACGVTPISAAIRTLEIP